MCIHGTYMYVSEKSGFSVYTVVQKKNAQNILKEKSLAIIYNGVSHRRSLKHWMFLIGRFANMSVV